MDSHNAIGFSSAPFGWELLGTLKYLGVTWRITAPKDDPWGSFSISRIEVETPPRCSRCGTEIEQSHSFWGGYIWKCVGCNFKKRNGDSYYDEGRRAGKIARNKFEKQKEKSSDGTI
jgi:ribosomal protein L37AE/L43A